jgi:predicted PurR-regulated permease PerM
MAIESVSAESEAAPTTVAVVSDARSISLVVLAVLATVLMLHWAKDVLVPIALAVFLSYLFTPSVRWLKRRAKLPNAVGAALVLGIAVGGIFAGAVALEPQARKLLDIVPEAARKLDQEIRRSALDKESAMAKVKEAAAELERAAAAASEAASPEGAKPKPKAAPAPPPPQSRADEYFWVGTATALAGVASTVVVIALVYLLLVAGDDFKRKMVRISGDTLSQKKITVEILEEIDRQIQRYLLIHVLTSVAHGIAVWIAFALIGLENGPVWAVAAGVLHLVPYVGTALAMVITGVVAYLQFDDFTGIALIVGSQLAIGYLIGMLIVPWATQKMSRINAVTIFIALLFWGWLWGVWGLLLGVPIMMAIKAVCERAEGWQPVAELLGQEPPKAVIRES